MTKQQEFNRIKAVIENPKNELKHLDSIKVMVNEFFNKYDGHNLSSLLMEKFMELELKLLK
jgi:hypothetical protein